MYFDNRKYETVFILGSGASRGAIPHVLHNQKRIKPPLNSDFFKVAETYARACGPESPESKRLERINKSLEESFLTQQSLLTMESAFSFFYMAKDFPAIYSKRRGKRRDPGDSKEIEDFLHLSFGILTLLDQCDQKQNQYDKLVENLTPSDTLISLNYDTLLDSALYRKGWNPEVGYKIIGGSSKHRWKQRNINKDLSNISLLKLHGSLNWYVKGSFSDLSSVFEKKPSIIAQPRKNEISDHLRQIIPPIYGKVFGHDHWRLLWSEAYRALCGAEVLVVIGCSLIDTDFHLRALIWRAIQRRKHNNQFKRIYIVDRKFVRQKWQNALKSGYRCINSYNKFSKFIEMEV
jgi:hypothetical protein